MDELLSLIGPELVRQSTNYRAAIEPKQRLAVGLRYIANFTEKQSLATVLLNFLMKKLSHK